MTSQGYKVGSILSSDRSYYDVINVAICISDDILKIEEQKLLLSDFRKLEIEGELQNLVS